MIAQTVIVAVLIGKGVPILVEAGLLPRGLFWWVIPASIFSAVMTVDASRFWSFGYLAGVVIGIAIALPLFIRAGFLGPLDLLIYGGVAVGAVGLRVKIHSSSF
ncbi:hypothetical protein [Haloprofundus salilacus]|uniref:hypothetical protein n=1 Tax=Haloprofundus salilacus TaxID=2876190 RepID=UPI001CCD7052|nr:hypothetical protein [Haloprofundus salilacus]